MPEITSLEAQDSQRMRAVGVDLAHTRPRAGTFVQVDNTPLQAVSNVEGLEIMDLGEALERYDWLHELRFSAVAKDKDEFTRAAAEAAPHGYFIRALPGARIEHPVQACLYTRTEKEVQVVHNILIAEEGAELSIITGCATGTTVHSAKHIGISEFFIRKGAKMTFSMIHHWAEQVQVRPRSVAVVEAEGSFISNYVCMKPVKDVQMYPLVRLVGEGATATLGSTLVGLPGGVLDIGGAIELAAPRTRGDIISRAVSRGGRIIARGRLIGKAPESKAHLECRGLLLDDGGSILAVPELEAEVANLELSHEAAVGKLAQEQIDYLMARGLTEDEAVQMIIRGFLTVKIEGLPEELEEEMEQVLALSAEQAF